MSWWDDTWVNVGRFLLMDTWAGQAANWTWNNGQDLARIGFGVVEFGFGFVACSTGFGFVLGFPMIALGIDQIITGSMNIRYGRVGKNHSYFEDQVFQATGNKTAALAV